MATELAKGLYWTGVVDWGLRHFHGFELSTHRGTSYNSFLLTGEKTVLVETVWQPCVDQFLENIREVVEPARIDYVIASHAEPDHSGGLPALMQLCPQATVVVSPRGRESIRGHYHKEWNFRVVKTGDRIALGDGELVFVEAPMLHWPDSLFAYLTGQNVLFSTDAFGEHYATSLRFNDQVDQAELFQEAVKYYANILTPFSEMVSRKIEELMALALPVDMICPSHGVIWRRDPMQIVRRYQEWARQVPQPRAVILFDTMWDGTRRMAEAIGSGLGKAGVPFALYHMGSADRNDVVAEVFRAQAVIIGSPTVNRGILPGLMPVLEDLRGLRFRNKIGAAFAAYGWSGESLEKLEAHLKACNFEIAAPGVRALWQPNAVDLAKCEALGREVAGAMRAAGTAATPSTRATSGEAP